MATLKGAKYTPEAVPDYIEDYASGTYKRIYKAGLYEQAAARWKKFAESQKPPIFKRDPQYYEKRAYWMRVHYPPVDPTSQPSSSLPSAESSERAVSETLGDSNPLQETEASDSLKSETAQDCSSESTVDGEPCIHVPSPKSNPLTQNPIDNSCPIEHPDLTAMLSPEEFLLNAKWVAYYGMHVLAGRRAIREAPNAAFAWLLLEVMKNNPKDYVVSVIQAFAKIEEKKIAALKEIEAEKAKKFNERRSGDIDVSLLLTELGAAESQQGPGVLQPTEVGRDAIGSENAEGEHRVSEEAA